MTRSPSNGSGPERRERPLRCLLLTPAARFGSWHWMEKVIELSGPDARWLVVSYGKPEVPLPNARFISLPAIRYARVARLMSKRRYLALNLVYFLPLYPVAWVAGAVFRPQLLVGNGLVASAALAPLKLLGGRLFVTFHGYVGHAGPLWQRVIRRAMTMCDVAFVNSETSADDLRKVIEPDKIVLVPHWADEVFFELPLERPPHDQLVVLFVGRLDSEKFAQCMRVMAPLAAEGVAQLWAVGTGPLAHHLRGKGLRRFGYIENREELARVYGAADVVWAPADTTYLSRPGVEALAAGCPVIVSDTPAVDPRAEAGARVPRDLVPSGVGAVVNGVDDTEATDLVRRFAREGIHAAERRRCRELALARHSPSNAIDVLLHLRG